MFTPEELSILIEAVQQQIVSAQRQQNAKRGTAMIKAVYEKHEAVLKALELKLTSHLTDTITNETKRK